MDLDDFPLFVPVPANVNVFARAAIETRGHFADGEDFRRRCKRALEGLVVMAAAGEILAQRIKALIEVLGLQPARGSHGRFLDMVEMQGKEQRRELPDVSAACQSNNSACSASHCLSEPRPLMKWYDASQPCKPKP